MCDIDGTDPYTDAWQLCDDDGMVRRGVQHHGTDYACTGHEHIATPAGRYHIRCTSPAHQVQRTVIYPTSTATGINATRVGSLTPQGQTAIRLGGDTLPPWGYQIVGVGYDL